MTLKSSFQMLLIFYSNLEMAGDITAQLRLPSWLILMKHLANLTEPREHTDLYQYREGKLFLPFPRKNKFWSFFITWHKGKEIIAVIIQCWKQNLRIFKKNYQLKDLKEVNILKSIHVMSHYLTINFTGPFTHQIICGTFSWGRK